MRASDFSIDTPNLPAILADGNELFANGGSCLTGPDGEWLVEPQVGEKKLIVAKLDHRRMREERQNFDPAGHYSCPDVTRLTVNRARQSTIAFKEQG
jgi:nitrilase